MPMKCIEHLYPCTLCFAPVEITVRGLLVSCARLAAAKSAHTRLIRRQVMVATVLAVSLVLAMLALPGGASAQPRELFTPVPFTLSTDPSQAQRIDQFRSRPTTQSLTLVRIDVDALRG